MCAHFIRFHVELAPIEIEFQVVNDQDTKAYETLQRWCKRGISVKLDLAEGFKLGLFSSETDIVVQGKKILVKMNQSKPLKFVYHSETEQDLCEKFLSIEVSKMSKFLKRSQSLSREDDESFNDLKKISVVDMVCGPEYSWTEFSFLTKSKSIIHCKVLIMHKFIQDCPHMLVLVRPTEKTSIKIISSETGQIVSTMKDNQCEISTNANEIFSLIAQTNDQEFPIFRHASLEILNGPKFWQLRESIKNSKILKRVDQSPWPSPKVLEKINAYYSLQGCFPLDIVNRLDGKFRTLLYMIQVKSQFNLLPSYLMNFKMEVFERMLEQYKATMIREILLQTRPRPRQSSPSSDWIVDYNFKMKQERDEIMQYQKYQENQLQQIQKECKRAIVQFKLVSKIPVTIRDLS